jgi:hypothetical protein
MQPGKQVRGKGRNKNREHKLWFGYASPFVSRVESIYRKIYLQLNQHMIKRKMKTVHGLKAIKME